MESNHFNGLVWGGSISIPNALEIPQYCNKPLTSLFIPNVAWVTAYSQQTPRAAFTNMV